MFYQISLLPQVKPIVIISKKHGIYELPHELSKTLDLGNYEILTKSQIFIEL